MDWMFIVVIKHDHPPCYAVQGFMLNAISKW